MAKSRKNRRDREKDRRCHGTSFLKTPGIVLASPKGERGEVVVAAGSHALIITLKREGAEVTTLHYRDNRSLKQIESMLRQGEEDLAQMGFTVQEILDAVEKSRAS